MVEESNRGSGALKINLYRNLKLQRERALKGGVVGGNMVVEGMLLVEAGGKVSAALLSSFSLLGPCLHYIIIAGGE